MVPAVLAICLSDGGRSYVEADGAAYATTRGPNLNRTQRCSCRRLGQIHDHEMIAAVRLVCLKVTDWKPFT